MKRRMAPKISPHSPAVLSMASVSDPVQVSFRRTKRMKDRHGMAVATVAAAAVGVNVLLFGVVTDAFIPISTINNYRLINESALFVASIPNQKNTKANPPFFGREGGADSVGLQSGLGADAPARLDAGEMSSILDDGSGHINAELARSIWQWGEC